MKVATSLVLALLLWMAAASGAAATPRHAHKLRARARPDTGHAAIIGGTEAEAGAFPQLASIVHEGDGEGESFACTGTVVAANVVLTAGHCGESTETGLIEAASGYAVTTGNVDWNSPDRQVSGVSRVVIYPDFNRTLVTGDAALLILSTPTTEPALPLATYPSDEHLLEAGTLALMAGWGKRFSGQTWRTEWLEYAPTVVQRPGYCENNAPPFYEGAELCTIYPPEDETGLCFGDSGGPLIARNPTGSGDVELGVASHGYGECETVKPSVFTRADLIAPWVNEWIAAVKPPPPTPPVTVTPTPAPKPSPAPAPAPTPTPTPTPTLAAPAAPAPLPNLPGDYITRPSKLRRIIVHVAGDGSQVVGLHIKMPVPCRHGYELPLDQSWLSYAEPFSITNHFVARTLEFASRETGGGTIGVWLHFTAAGKLEGRLRVHVLYRSRRIGLCAGTLSFTAGT